MIKIGKLGYSYCSLVLSDMQICDAFEKI